MGNREEKFADDDALESAPVELSASWADFRLLLGQFREFAVAPRGKLVGAAALFIIEIALVLTFVFAFALLADSAAATADSGVVGRAVGGDAGQMAAFLCLAALLLVACAYFERLWTVQVGEKAVGGLSKKVFAQVVSQPLAFFAGSGRRAIDERIVDDINCMRRAWSRDLFTILKCALLVFVVSFFMFRVAPELAGPVLGMASLVGAVWALSVWLLIKKGHAIYGRRDSSGVDVAITETVAGLTTVKAFGNETHERTRFRHRVDNFTGSAVRSAGTRMAVLAAGSLILFGTMIYLWWFGIVAVREERFLAGQFTAFVALLIIAAIALSRIPKIGCRLVTASRAAGRLDALLAAAGERLDSGTFMPASRERLEGRLNISEASFSYSNEPDQLVIDSLSLAVLPGGTIAVVGPPGSGKTALAQLILGYYPLQSGSVEIDDRPLADYPLAWLRSQIGWVPAETCLFSGSLAENIAYGRVNASVAEIREAAEKAGALPFIESLRDGFDTLLAGDTGGGRSATGTESGLRLTAEQKRRIALARVFLEDPPMVFIDAPATSIDEKAGAEGKSAGDAGISLERVEEALMQDRTAIVVATRMSTTRAMDKILVLRDGRIVERGSHHELYEGRGFYRLLCEGQFGRD